MLEVEGAKIAGHGNFSSLMLGRNLKNEISAIFHHFVLILMGKLNLK